MKSLVVIEVVHKLGTTSGGVFYQGVVWGTVQWGLLGSWS